MRARSPEAGIIGGGDHGALLDQLAQPGHLLKDEYRKRRRTCGTTPVVGCAQATISRPPAGAGPGGTTITPERRSARPACKTERYSTR